MPRATGRGCPLRLCRSTPRVNEATTLTANIANAPEGEISSYGWQIDMGGGEWLTYGSGPMTPTTTKLNC